MTKWWFQEILGTLEDISVRTEPAQVVKDSPGGEVVVRYEAGAEDVQSTGGGASQGRAEEEAARRNARAEAMTRAVEEEVARRNARAEALRTLEEEKARRKARYEKKKSAVEEEAARRGFPL